MKQIILITILFILTPLAVAEEAPKYNFATTQATSTILIQPGETIKVPAIYFFNIYGNRITHVTLSLTNAPKGWNVKIEPEMHEVQVNISGTIVTSSENLYVSPSQPVKEVPSVIPEDVAYITLGGIEGNVPAKVAYLNITIPKETPLGGIYSISIKATGSWFGQAATLALTQERSFDFKVQTVTYNFTEEPVTTTSVTPVATTPKPSGENKESNYLIYIMLILLVLTAILGFYAGRKKK